MFFLTYLWVTALSAVSSALVVVPAFIFADVRVELVATTLFVSLAHFFVVGTVGWGTAWLSRRLNVFSKVPVVLVGAALAAFGWYLFGILLHAAGEVPEFAGGWWLVCGAVSGAIAGMVLSRFAFPDHIHRAQFAEERLGRPSRYRAFLSYSRTDEATAVRVWRSLDGYRVPQALVGKPGRFGTTPARLYPIFRDREELSSGEALTALLTRALENSEVLIVLLSPAAARSAWVNRELQLFIESKGIEGVLPVLASGQPDDPTRPDYCLPPALVGRDILAADLRDPSPSDGGGGGDGYKVGILKLIAGILGTDLEDLRRREAIREAKRHSRLMATIAVLSSTAILSMTLFAVAAGFYTWAQGVIDTNIEAEADRLVAIYDQQGAAGLGSVLQFDTLERGFCRALVRTNGSILSGAFPEEGARRIAETAEDAEFSIRYEEVPEYGGSPFALRIEGVTRHVGNDHIIIVALCHHRPPYFYGSFRSLFDRRKLDLVVRLQVP